MECIEIVPDIDDDGYDDDNSLASLFFVSAVRRLAGRTPAAASMQH